MNTDFADWLATMLRQRKQQVAPLLQSTDALHFLIAWSIFEAKCFQGYLTKDLLGPFSVRVTRDESFDVSCVYDDAEHFHARYQDRERYRHLVQGQRFPEVDRLLRKPFGDLDPAEVVLLLATTVYRFRNNMFHGNKGVSTWLS